MLLSIHPIECQFFGGIGPRKFIVMARFPVGLRTDGCLSAASGKPQEAHTDTLAAEIGSLTLEFTRLSQLSNDPKYYDAIHRVMEQFDIHQNRTKLPGMWPVVVDAKDLSFLGNSDFTFGAMSDSLYEYLPKVCTSKHEWPCTSADGFSATHDARRTRRAIPKNVRRCSGRCEAAPTLSSNEQRQSRYLVIRQRPRE